MPMEGHWERVNTPLRETTPRERYLVRGFAILLAAATAAVLLVSIASSSGPDGGATGATGQFADGCMQIEMPSTMGAASTKLCGDGARQFCASRAAHTQPLSATALPMCRDAGYQ